MEAEITDTPDHTVLVLAPLGRDAELAVAALARVGIHAVVCANLATVIERLAITHGAVLLAEEALTPASLPAFTALLNLQAPWSDLPIILLTGGGNVAEASPAPQALFGPRANVTLLERPIRVVTLCSTARVALRARRRQYEVRDLLRQREEVLASERAARSEAERAGRMKDEFLATLSHELRTPLNAILGWCALLRRGKTDAPDLAEGLEIIERNARSQAGIIEDLLDMSRIISGKIRLEMHPVDLAEIVEAAVDTVRPAAEAKQIVLRAALDSGTGLVSGDANRLQQVFWNLLTNAVKFTPPRGTIEVTLQHHDTDAEINVRDSGDGIKPAFLPLVFDRFRQADSSTTRHHGGLGLGLAIVKQLVELHGGRVSAFSDGQGEGATFTVQLPLAQRSAGESAVAPSPEAAREFAPAASFSADWNCRALAGVNIVVVDDEPDARDIVKRLLEKCDARVRSASCAAEALRLIETEPPDVLISDIGMPGEDGYSLIRRVRALPAERGGNTPAVALSAYARTEDRERSLRCGFQLHAVKPIEPAELFAVITRLVQRDESEISPAAVLDSANPVR